MLCSRSLLVIVFYIVVYIVCIYEYFFIFTLSCSSES